MARKKKPEEHENHERWLISYADFITLLFAFFVVMYSVSSVNEGKYRVVSRSLIAAFGTPVKSLAPIQIGELVRAKDSGIKQQTLKLPSAMKAAASNPMLMNPPESHSSGSGQPGNGGEELMKEVAEEIDEALQELIEKGLVTVRENNGRLEIEIRSSVLFASGSGEVSVPALPILEGIAGILKTLPNMVHVEGFTDNVPISNLVYPSNWELSAGRSARVVRHLVEGGIDPLRLVSVGYGEYRPVASNKTAEGRARNRRVVLVVTAHEPDSDPLLAQSFSRTAIPVMDLDEALAAASLNTEPPVSETGQRDFKVDPALLKYISPVQGETAEQDPVLPGS
jgi:chemotaxis protein MotB